MRYKVLDKDFKVNEHPFWDKVERGDWEEAVIEKLSEIVKPTDIIFDVGAWIGVYTLLLSSLANTVVAFEPCPFSRKILTDNLERNGITNVKVEPLALSDKEGTEKIYYYNPTKIDEVLASSMWNMINRGMKTNGISIPTTTIDSYCEKNHISPDGIKIDVEGYENEVLAGCSQKCWKMVEVHDFAATPDIEGEIIDSDMDRGHILV